MSKVTRWFPPALKPVHIGIYETRRHEADPMILFSHWDGMQWRTDTYRCYAAQFSSRSAYQNRPWRGLKEKSE